MVFSALGIAGARQNRFRPCAFFSERRRRLEPTSWFERRPKAVRIYVAVDLDSIGWNLGVSASGLSLSPCDDC
jgi:hypothetical protein